jgi:multisubunit Na+/H+ antiporter MnhG subunit
MVYVIILRLIKGKSPFFGSPDHFALRLKKKYNLSPAKTVSVIIGVQLVISGVVVLNFYTTPLITIISTALIFLFFVIFGLVLALVRMK